MKTWTLIASLLTLPVATLHATTAHAEDAAPSSVSVTFDVVGMVTKNCPTLLKAAVSRIDGVEAVEASLQTKSATVTYRPAKTNPEAIRRIIEDRTGFDVRPRG